MRIVSIVEFMMKCDVHFPKLIYMNGIRIYGHFKMSNSYQICFNIIQNKKFKIDTMCMSQTCNLILTLSIRLPNNYLPQPSRAKLEN